MEKKIEDDNKTGDDNKMHQIFLNRKKSRKIQLKAGLKFINIF